MKNQTVNVEPMAQKESAQMGKYFYSVIFADGRAPLDLVGIDGCKVEAIQYRDIAAVVSDYPLTTIKTLRKNLLPYYQVNRTIAKASTVIPARFGQIAKNGEEVLSVLRKNYSRIKAELDRLHAKVEMGLKVFWEVENVFEYIIGGDSALRAYRDRLLRRPKAPSRQEQLDFGLLLSDRLKQMREKISQKVIALLRAAAHEIKVDEPTDEKMAMNGIFLVAAEKQKEFMEMADRAAVLIGEDYDIKVDGPWIPFNFVEHIELGL